ncbi:50S ribosomal protein L6 [Lactobacillus intestinalis]|uniref:50S ribosomal protein L6 n=1 Tax=Lactobacillus intestinalis TaxID=151781 RepID=UPI0026ECE971|nr:50S ribosomal protein L6 [Lactobacillus intestinalis]
MSRIGIKPIVLPEGVNFNVDGNTVTVTGKLGTLSRTINPNITVSKEGNELIVSRNSEDAKIKAFHGLYRQLINNMVEGVSRGFEKKLNINGIGYKTTQDGANVILNIGYSHPVVLKPIDGIKVTCDKNIVTVSGIDKEVVGRYAAMIRDIKPVEPYHAYGISYVDEVIVRKEVKSGKK